MTNPDLHEIANEGYDEWRRRRWAVMSAVPEGRASDDAGTWLCFGFYWWRLFPKSWQAHAVAGALHERRRAELEGQAADDYFRALGLLPPEEEK